MSGPSMLPDDTGAPGPSDFDELFREHYWPMVRSLSVACGDPEAAADAVQEAFTRAFVRWRRISRYDSPSAWVRHVALNRVRDHFRHEERGVRARARLAGHARESVPPPELHDAPADVATMLAILPKQQRIAAALYYVEELSVREIAETMKLSEGAVKYHLHAARTALRDRLGGP
ncbi:MAG TPA: sigma-70 family RNA polymerase sigma factor [Acidimicrobiia bacterium]|nr:sigma-70 family RNA polymerase sigma factor [Acidimicrobiia bacterium]